MPKPGTPEWLLNTEGKFPKDRLYNNYGGEIEDITVKIRAAELDSIEMRGVVCPMKQSNPAATVLLRKCLEKLLVNSKDQRDPAVEAMVKLLQKETGTLWDQPR